MTLFLKIEGQLPQRVSFLFLEGILYSSFKIQLALPSLRGGGLFPWGIGCLSSGFLQHSVNIFIWAFMILIHSFIYPVSTFNVYVPSAMHLGSEEIEKKVPASSEAYIFRH